MRTDLTVRTASGEHDLAVFAPAGTSWDVVSCHVRAALGDGGPQWCGRHALHPRMVIGRSPLLTGAVLTGDRPASHGDSTMRLEVVGGRDCGASVAVTTQSLVVGRDPDCHLVLGDPQVSRHHARMRVGAAGVTAVDLGSTGGIHLCGRPVTTARLGPGTVLRVGPSFVAVTGVAGTMPQPVAVTVPQPPEPPTRTARLPLLATLLPAVLGAALALVTRSWEFLAFAALTPLAGLAGAGAERRHSRRAHRDALTRYRRARAQSENARADALRDEAVQRRQQYPHPTALVHEHRRTRERTARDLLEVRVGLGTMPSQVQPEGDVADVPVTIDLARGPVALVGPREVTRDLARWLLLQIAACTSPAEVALAVGARDRAGDRWRWARWLPHSLSATATAAHVVAVCDGAVTDAGLAIVLVDTVADVPRGCTTRVVVADEPGGTVFVYPPDGDARTAVADRVDPVLAERLARTLAATAHERPGAELPSRCRLTELIGAADLRARWAASTGSADTTIGVGAGGPVRIDLDRDGPHLLVAGSTGAGKSELLQSLVTGLALEHPPAEMSFLLVDYKGGAAFGDCARLPHTVGLVTDLDSHLTRRVLTALDSETARRERLFAAAGVADLGGYRAASPETSIARLVIVVDEFATLADELGDFVPSLVGIARRGRSLGLHLVLATQRPSGVVSPEIRANTALRICLRVTSAAESIDVVDVADAADIAQGTPGRAILRTGADIRTFQAACVSGGTDESSGAVHVVRLHGWRELAGPPARDIDTDLQRAVARIHAAHHGLAPPHRPWLEPLPKVLPLDRLAAEPGVAVGRVDLPDRQQQPALTVDLDKGATVLITGGSRSGRSSALNTVAHAAANQHRPHQLHLYGIDATGGGLAALRALPHTGTVATLADGFDFTAHLVDRLAAAQRRSLLLIDGWDELLAASDEFDGGRTAERVTNLLRAAAQGRLTSVVTGGRATLSPRLSTLATTRFVLGLNDSSDYAAAGVPSHRVVAAPPPGRGLRAGDWAPVQFAVADPPPCPAGEPARDAIRIRPLPRSVSLAQLPPCAGTVLGVYGDTGAIASADLVATAARVLVAGPPRSGRSTVLCTILRQHEACAVIAPARSPLVAAAGGHRVVQQPGDLPPSGLLLVDDLEHIADTGLGDAVAAWADDGTARRAVVAAGRIDAFTLGYRGVIASLRAHSCGILLRPGAADGALLGVTVPTIRVPLPVGRGVLVADPRWGIGVDPVPIQIATP